MQLTNDSLAVCSDCNCVVMGPHPCQPHEGYSSLWRAVFMINREQLIRERAERK